MACLAGPTGTSPPVAGPVHPDRYSSNEELRRQGQERLKRANDAYDRLRKFLVAGGASICSQCGELADSAAALCATCQREHDLAEREKRAQQRETELNATRQKLKNDRLRIQREQQAASEERLRVQGQTETRASRSVVGEWFNGAGMQCFEIVENGSGYQYRGGPLEQGTVVITGNNVTVRGRNAMIGDFTSALRLDGGRLHGTLTSAMFGLVPLSMPVEYWRR